MAWSQLSLERLARLVPSRGTVTPAGRASGSAAFSGTLSDAASWELELSNCIVAARATAGLLPVSGQSALFIEEGRWRFLSSL